MILWRNIPLLGFRSVEVRSYSTVTRPLLIRELFDEYPPSSSEGVTVEASSRPVMGLSTISYRYPEQFRRRPDTKQLVSETTLLNRGGDGFSSESRIYQNVDIYASDPSTRYGAVNERLCQHQDGTRSETASENYQGQARNDVV